MCHNKVKALCLHQKGLELALLQYIKSVYDRNVVILTLFETVRVWLEWWSSWGYRLSKHSSLCILYITAMNKELLHFVLVWHFSLNKSNPQHDLRNSAAKGVVVFADSDSCYCSITRKWSLHVHLEMAAENGKRSEKTSIFARELSSVFRSVEFPDQRARASSLDQTIIK